MCGGVPSPYGGLPSRRSLDASSVFSHVRRFQVTFLAQTEPAATGGGGSLLIYMLFFGAVAYFFMIRPQRNRARRQQMLASQLEIGDQVRTIGGLFGVVIGLEPDSVVLGVEEGRIRVAKGAVASRIDTESDAADAPPVDES